MKYSTLSSTESFIETTKIDSLEDRKIINFKKEILKINLNLRRLKGELKKISEKYLRAIEYKKFGFTEAFEMKIFKIENSIKELERDKIFLKNKIRAEVALYE